MHTLASELMGLPIILFSTGQKYKQVKDIIYDDQTNSVTALLVDSGGLLSSAMVIPFPKIQSIGEDAVIVANEECIVDINSVDEINQSLTDQVTVKGKTIMTEDGKNLGKVGDLAIDNISGKVLGYVASGGIFADMYNGQSYVPAPITIKVGEDVLFVPTETADMVSDQIGGLKKVAQDTGAAVVSGAEKAKDAVVEGYEKTKEKATELADQAKETYESDKVQNVIEDAKDRAKESWDITKQGVKDLTAKAKDTAEDTVETIKEKSHELSSEIKEKTKEAGDIVGHQADKLQSKMSSMSTPDGKVVKETYEKKIIEHT